MLLRELLFKVFENIFHRTVVDVTCHSKREHVLAFDNSLPVKATVFQTLFRQCRDRCHDDGPVLYIQFSDRITFQTGSFETFFIKCVSVNQNQRSPLEPFGIGLESCRVHRHKHVAEVTRGVDMSTSDMDLKARHT